MTFQNSKKTFLDKLDKSKKGEIDPKVVSLLELINSKDNYFTTSSCSGRAVLWSGSGKKNEIEWLKVSHDLVDGSFLELPNSNYGLIWLRLEPFILHVCCKDLDSANKLLNLAKQTYKKSSLLSISNKIIVEVKGSEYLEIPLVKEGHFLIEDKLFLLDLINQKLNKIHGSINLFYKTIKEKNRS